MCWYFLTEWHQLSVVGWQRHGVHTLGPNRWRRRRCARRMCVHGCERRLAESRLWDPATRSPLSRSPCKSVLLWWKNSTQLLFSRFCHWHWVTRHTILCSLSQAANRSSHTRWRAPPRGSNLDKAVTTLSPWCRNLHLKRQESTAGRKVGIHQMWPLLLIISLIAVLHLSHVNYHDWKLEILSKELASLCAGWVTCSPYRSNDGAALKSTML